MTGTLDFSANNNSPTMQTFNGSGTGTRTLNMGSGTWNLTGNATTIWTTATTTNLTLNRGTSTINCTYSGATGTRTFTHSGVVTLYNIKVSAGSDIFALTSSGEINDLDFTGFTGSWTNNGNTIGGNLILGSGMTTVSGGAATTFVATTSKTITTNGVQLNRPITFSGVGGTWTLQDSLNMDGATARTLTLTNGTFNSNNFNVTCGSFSSSNSNTRVLTMGSGTWTLTGNNATIWTTSTTTNLTLNEDTSTINCTYSGSTGTRTIVTGGTVGALNHFKVSAGTDILVTPSSNFLCNDFDLTGFTGTWSAAPLSTSGNFTLGAGMTATGGAFTITFTATNSKTINTNGVNINRSFTFNGVGGTWTLLNNLDINGAQTDRAITLTNGTFNANGFNVSTLSFSSNNTNVRTLTMGSGTWTLTGTGTVWNTGTVTNLTLNAGTSTILINDASASSKTFSSGTATFGNLTLEGSGSGTFIIGTQTATNIFNVFTVSTAPHTVQVFAGKTIIASSIAWSGTSGNLNTFQSTTNGTSWTINVPSGTISQDYISLQDSTATGSIPFYAGAHSTNVSGNTNWLFIALGSLKYYVGNQWVVKTLKYWNGTSWVARDLQFWNGTTWNT